MDIVELLRHNTDLFKGFETSELEVVAAAAEVRELEVDSVLCRTGDAGASLFLVAKGRLAIQREVKNDRVTLAVLKPGEACGEMSLVDGSARTADVVATDRAVVLEIDREAFDHAMTGNPSISNRFWQNVAAVLSRRLAQTNDMVAEYVRINRRLLEDDEFRRFYSTL